MTTTYITVTTALVSRPVTGSQKDL